MNKYVEGLREGLKMFEQSAIEAGGRVRARRGVKLSYFNIYTLREISQIVGVSERAIAGELTADIESRNTKEHEGATETWPARVWVWEEFIVDRQSVFDPRTLDALLLLAEDYKDTGSIQGRGNLVRKVAEWGTSLYTQSELTGIPLSKLRGALLWK